MANMNSYIEQLQKVLANAKVLLSESDWEFVKEDDGIICERKEFKDVCPIPCYRVSGQITNKSFEEVKKLIWTTNEARAKELDPSIIYWKIEKENDDKSCRVVVQRNKLMFPLWTREGVCAQAKFHEEGKLWSVAASVSDPDIVTDENEFVLTKIHMTVTLVEKTDDGITYHKIAQIDPCGNIPQSVVNYFASNTMDIVKKLRN